jgi:hypothetical protein
MADVIDFNQSPPGQKDQIIEDLTRYIKATDRMLLMMSESKLQMVEFSCLAIDRANAKSRAVHNGYLWPDGE